MKAIPHIQYSLAQTPTSDNHLSPAAMLLGGIPRHPSLLLQKPEELGISSHEMKRALIVQRKMDHWLRENKTDQPKRPYTKQPQEFKAGDIVRIRSEPQVEASKKGIPRKWVFKWHEKGIIQGPVEGHPDQYYVKKTNTGRIIKRSGCTLSKVPRPDEAVQPQNLAVDEET